MLVGSSRIGVDCARCATHAPLRPQRVTSKPRRYAHSARRARTDARVRERRRACAHTPAQPSKASRARALLWQTASSHTRAQAVA
eukprot:6181514-Pleurochrysis_carterae.AAC.1